MDALILILTEYVSTFAQLLAMIVIMVTMIKKELPALIKKKTIPKQPNEEKM